MPTNRDQVRSQRLERCLEAAARWRARAAKRQENLKELRSGRDADSPERVLAYAQREAERPSANPAFRSLVRTAVQAEATATEKVRFLERRIGSTLDWQPTPSGDAAQRAGQSVGRICSSPDAVQAAGFATGFLVSPSLLLTNHHVFAEGQDAEGTFVQFGYEMKSGAVQAGIFFEIDPSIFFASHGDLDFALVGVKAISVDGRDSLEDLKANRLIATTGKILIGHPISIIQYPGGGTKRYAESQNELMDVLDDFLQYRTDTLPGSSGSPCFNKAWEVVALHHSGIPRTQGGQMMTIDGGPWDPSMSEDQIDWIANEGIRVSRIVEELQKGEWGGKQPLMDALYEGRRAVDPSSPPRNAQPAVRPPRSSALSPATVRTKGTPDETVRPTTVIHVHAASTFFVGCGTPGTAATEASDGAAVISAPEKKIRFDTNYTNREGYQSDFLGIDIPHPEVSAARKKEMVKGAGNKVLVLPYHHFSLAMNQDRRFQMWSAVNVDYSEAARKHAQNRDAFGEDYWIPDPRLPEDLQVLDDEFYKPATNIDRGHVVRRDDNCWGSTKTKTEYANSDTFHWTNCTPQHERFNQSRQAGLWGQLEDVIKDRAEGGFERLSIFAGPVLADDDPDAYGIKYPVRFWKVVAAIVDGALEAYGFVLDQSATIDEFGLEVIDFGKFTIHQRSLNEIEAMTGVRFPQVLRSADVLLGNEAILIDGQERVFHGERIPRGATRPIIER